MCKQVVIKSFLALGALLFLTACKKPTCADSEKNQDEVEVDCGGVCSPCAISYPENGSYGINVLNQTTTWFSTSSQYSLSASVPSGSSVLVKFQHGGPDFNGSDIWFYGSEQNLFGSAYDEITGQQDFQSIGSGNAEVLFEFGGSASATITIYENGSSNPSRTKTITWG